MIQDNYGGLLNPRIVADIQEHAIDAFPDEACGLITEAGYVRCVNASPTPRDDFMIPPEQYLDHDVLAVVHSHPNGPDAPSAQDMRGQIDSAVPWVIVATNGKACRPPFAWGDSLAIPPLIGRQFRHGVSDCYDAVRDCFRLGKEAGAQLGCEWPHDAVTLPAAPRDADWWNDGGDLYRQNFSGAGFERIDQPEPGAVFLASIMSKVPNHAGVYLGRGLVFHHLQNRLSRRDPVNALGMKRVSHWLRYVGA